MASTKPVDVSFDTYCDGIEASAIIAKAYEEAQADAALLCTSEAERIECEARSFAAGEIAATIRVLLATTLRAATAIGLNVSRIPKTIMTTYK